MNVINSVEKQMWLKLKILWTLFAKYQCYELQFMEPAISNIFQYQTWQPRHWDTETTQQVNTMNEASLHSLKNTCKYQT